MIDIEEIRSVAAKVQLSNMVVEKDYALGWLLWGINHLDPDNKFVTLMAN
jgi:predicted nucleotidyltransferase component of viral defense system